MNRRRFGQRVRLDVAALGNEGIRSAFADLPTGERAGQAKRLARFKVKSPANHGGAVS